jgi:hypothetical protein
VRKPTLFFLLVLLGSVASYGQAPAKHKPTFPQIVARFERLNQTGPISPTTIFTPTHCGTFQVSIVMVQTVAGGNGIWFGTFNWTDGSGSDSTNLQLDTFQRQSANSVFAARVKAGTPFSFQITESNTPGGKYNVWIVVQQLM